MQSIGDMKSSEFALSQLTPTDPDVAFEDGDRGVTGVELPGAPVSQELSRAASNCRQIVDPPQDFIDLTTREAKAAGQLL